MATLYYLLTSLTSFICVFIMIRIIIIITTFSHIIIICNLRLIRVRIFHYIFGIDS